MSPLWAALRIDDVEQAPPTQVDVRRPAHDSSAVRRRSLRAPIDHDGFGQAREVGADRARSCGRCSEHDDTARDTVDWPPAAAPLHRGQENPYCVGGYRGSGDRRSRRRERGRPQSHARRRAGDLRHRSSNCTRTEPGGRGGSNGGARRSDIRQSRSQRRHRGASSPSSSGGARLSSERISRVSPSVRDRRCDRQEALEVAVPLRASDPHDGSAVGHG